MRQVTNDRKHGGRLLQLDGIKGVICFFIIFVHYYNRTPSGMFPLAWIPSVFVEKGWIFVEFFFIISGFLFAYSQKERVKDAELKEYIAARLKRVYPSVMFVTVLDVLTRLAQMAINHIGDRLTLAGILQSLTFTTTWLYNGEPFPTVVWYIHVLFLCYILYYFIGKGKDETAYMMGVIGLTLLGWTMYVAELNIPFLYKNIGRGYLSFAVGLLIFEFQNRVEASVRRKISYWAAIADVVIVGMALKFGYGAICGDVLLCCTLFFSPLLCCAC